MSVPARPLVRPQVGRYRSTAGAFYHVFGTAVDETDGVERVIFRPAGSVALTFLSLPVRDWCEKVSVAGRKVPRFVKVQSHPGEPGDVEAAGGRWP